MGEIENDPRYKDLLDEEAKKAYYPSKGRKTHYKSFAQLVERIGTLNYTTSNSIKNAQCRYFEEKLQEKDKAIIEYQERVNQTMDNQVSLLWDRDETIKQLTATIAERDKELQRLNSIIFNKENEIDNYSDLYEESKAEVEDWRNRYMDLDKKYTKLLNITPDKNRILKTDFDGRLSE